MSPLPDALREAVEPLTGPIATVDSVGGGDVSHAVRLDAVQGHFFLKWAGGTGGPSFLAEAVGLLALHAAAGPDLIVPVAHAARDAEADSPGWLLLDWVEHGRPTAADWTRFGSALAALHRAEPPGGGRYGWAGDNWIGSKPQRNGWWTSWAEFFGERRLRAQARRVRALGAWDTRWDGPLDRLIHRLGEWLPAGPHPSLLHGDLWAGNAIPTVDGRFAILDPAVSVGHREADLAMTELFGGFRDAFYDGYWGTWPTDSGYPDRKAIYNLYHLTNHLTHGPGYRRPVENTLWKYGT